MALDAGATGEHPPHRAAVSNALLLLALGLVALVVSPIWKSHVRSVSTERAATGRR
jgi:hypothetical protein